MSEIRFKYSQIGGGKTFHSVIEMCEELERSDRFIVTNISVLLDDSPKGYSTFREYCQKWIRKPVDVGKRIAWLTKEQSMEFYRYLPAEGISQEDIERFGLKIHENVFERNGVVLTRSRLAELPLRPDPVYQHLVDFSARNHQTGCFKHGCHYFLDEVHKLFSARQYHKVSPRLEDYQSELRKLDDDLTLITQNPEKVDKNCRRNATDWIQVQNMNKTRLFMGVRLGSGRFRYHWFNQAEMPGKLDKPTVSGWYSFDKKRNYQNLYLTMDGVGVSGGMIAETNRQPGRHPVIWVGALVAICLFAWFCPRLLSIASDKIIGQTLGGMLSGVRDGVTGQLTNTVAQVSAPPGQPIPPTVSNTPAPRPRRIEPRPAAPAMPASEKVFVRMWSKVGDDMWVYLTNGQIAKSSRGEVQGVGASYCMINNQKVPVLP